MKKLILFTDLDGTLLDSNSYSFEHALPALHMLRRRDIPLVLCSSKTRKEIEQYRKKLDNHHPFISENGGGIFIPRNYFGSVTSSSSFSLEEEDDYLLLRLGARYADLRRAVEELRQEGFRITGFGDMTPAEIAERTGLDEHEAQLSKIRDFDEPLLFQGDERQLQALRDAIASKDFTMTQGAFFHILGNTDKGRAVSILIDLYARKYGDISTVALGDSPNDIPMLERVDAPVIVQKPGGTYDPRIDMPHLIKAEGIGPAGWNAAVLDIVSRCGC